MRELRSPRLKDYFSYNNKWTTFSDFYYFNQSVFNKFSIAVVFILLNLIIGIKIKTCLIISLSSTGFLFYLYAKAKKESLNIIVKRKIPLIAREQDLVYVEYTLSNTSSFILENFLITDSFDGTKTNLNIIDFGESIPEKSYIVKKKSYILDTGMGLKNFGPLTIHISDPLDIFHFVVIDHKIEQIKVYPQIEKIQDMVMRGDKYATQFGLYDTESRGETTNFIGIRQYREGDSLKRINWKLSLKAKKMIINEFEKNVNTTFSIILNMDEKLHMGRGNLSTWEYAKDICLALATKQIASGNSVQFFSNDAFLPLGTGQSHINFLELVVCTLPLSKSKAIDNNFIKRSILEISSESRVLYITPAFPSASFEENLEALKEFSKFNSNIHIVFIDGTQEIAGTVKGNAGLGFKGLFLQTQRLLDIKITELNNLGIECSDVKITTGISYEKQMINSITPIRGGKIV